MSRSLPLLFAVDELENALNDRLTPILASAELTRSQFHVLYMLVESGPMRLSELAEQLRCVKSNISYITRSMERDGLVALAPSPDDRRVRVLSPTKLGRKRYGVAKAGAQKLETALRRTYGGRMTDDLARQCLAAATTLDAM